MIDYRAVLESTKIGVLATRDDDKIQTRVFQYLFSDGNKAFFCTSNEKPVYSQLKKNPTASYCCYPSDFSPVLSVSGGVVFVNDPQIKKRILDENPAIQGIYNTPDNPAFETFYIDVEEVKTFSFAEGPKTYSL